MSFWDNNKDTFKAVGKATAKGIGRGTVAVSKAGYRTYKNHENKRNGVSETTEYSSSSLGSTTPLTKEQLLTLPTPPKRIPGQPPAVASTQQTQYIPQDQPMQQSVSLPPDMPQRQLPIPVQLSINPSPQTPEQPVNGQTNFQAPKFNYGIRMESDETIEKPKTPLPDVSKFAPPPIHKARGESTAMSKSSGKSTSGTATESVTKLEHSPSPALSADIDTLKFVAPPKPYRADSPANTKPSIQKPSPPPRLPARENTPLLNLVNSVNPINSGNDSILPTSETKKPPKPPKPIKKPQLMPSNPPPYRPSEVKVENTNLETTSLSEMPIIQPKPVSTTIAQPVTVTSEPEVKKTPPIKPKPKQLKPKPALKPKLNEKPTSLSPPPPPPPVRNYTRAPAAAPSNTPPKLDLQIETGWFAKSPLQLPTDLNGLNYSTSKQTTSQIVNGIHKETHQMNLSVRLKDLLIIKYIIIWQDDNINSAIIETKDFIPSPLTTPITNSDLVTYNHQFGEYIASWCEHHKQQQVGRGECWDLAKEALEKGCGKHAFVSTYTVHGYPILEIQGTESGITGKPQLDEIRRGDILQFETCTFYNQALKRTSTAGDPDHTSVVLRKDGDKLIVAEQNVNGARYVVEGEVVIRDLIKGKLVCYRAMPLVWGGDLN